MSEQFFGFDEDDEQTGREPYRRSPWRWICVLVVAVALLLTGFLLVTGMRTVQAAGENQPFVGHSWVITGTYSDLTHDLQMQTYNGVYSGSLPDDSNVGYQPFDNGLSDPAPAQPGQQVQFRGTQTGGQSDDFPREVDALLAVDDGTLRVVRTTEAGSMSPITSAGIADQRRNGWLLVGGGVLVFVAGTAGTVYCVRRVRREEGVR